MTYPTPGPIQPAQDYPGYRATGPRRTMWLWIALVIAVVIIVVLCAVVIAQSRDDKVATPATASPTPTTSGALAAPPTGTQPPPNGSSDQSMTCEGFTASVDASSQPGWHATIDHHGLGYAVPPDWTVAACGVRMGWAKPCPEGQCVIREMSAVSSVANPQCPKQNLAKAGVAGSKNPDIRAALEEESTTVPTIYTRDGQAPTVTFTPVREFTIGTHPAVQVVATVNGMAPNTCDGSSALHSIVVTTVPNVEGSVVFLMSLQQGVNATPNPTVIDDVVKTLRSPA